RFSENGWPLRSACARMGAPLRIDTLKGLYTKYLITLTWLHPARGCSSTSVIILSCDPINKIQPEGRPLAFSLPHGSHGGCTFRDLLMRDSERSPDFLGGATRAHPGRSGTRLLLSPCCWRPLSGCRSGRCRWYWSRSARPGPAGPPPALVKAGRTV